MYQNHNDNTVYHLVDRISKPSHVENLNLFYKYTKLKLRTRETLY